MPTNRNEPDYQSYTRDILPDLTGATRGPVARQERHRGVRKQPITIRIDTDVVDAFKALTKRTDGRGYQTLINQALREWLQQRELRELIRETVREELRRAESG